ncbi:MAG TPA: hypothetical protein P5154_02345 [Candidatus Izemoplasmatales bacterium]|nr:hypothetical protein [Bacillota bacterium]HRY77584.1 hypothetical protein [Candidatus Izemoplasmatales bacterium]
MIHIVSGKVNSGKTGKLAAMYQFFRNQGDGFVSVKEMEGDLVVGYRAMRLKTMEERPLLVRENRLPAGFDPLDEIGPFRMSRSGLAWIESELEAMLARGESPLYLDEIGPLELAGGGFAPIFRKCLATGTEMYIAVRKDIIPDVVNVFGIETYDIL